MSMSAISRFLIMIVYFVLAGCDVPSRSIVLLSPASKALSSPTFEPVDTAWNGRLLRIGEPPPGREYALGGESEHSHSFLHSHSGASDQTRDILNPIGLSVEAASGQHVHAIKSVGQEPTITSAATNMPPSIEIAAYVVNRGQRDPVPGMIVAIAADQAPTIPHGWLECDGSVETPDLRNRFIVIGTAEPGKELGSLSHAHDATHIHRWATTEPDPGSATTIGLMNVELNPPPGVRVETAPVQHSHGIAAEVPQPLRTAATEVLPPSFRVRFYAATEMARKMPAGAILPYLGTDAPWGYQLLKKVDGTPVEGRFLFGAAGLVQGANLFTGSETHVHAIPHTHQVRLLPATQQSVIGRKDDQAPPMAASDHGHLATIFASMNLQTLPASNVPLFVSIHFIIKK